MDKLWVINKPSGLSCQPTAGQDDVLAWCRRDHDASEQLAPINRLDRATSGIMLASECPETRAWWGQALTSRQVNKTYAALVHGRATEARRIHRPLMDARRGKPLPSETHVTVCHVFGRLTYVELEPRTGRKHQIRRHMEGIHHPIVGDDRYGKRPLPANAPHRLWLHCLSMSVANVAEFMAPLPDELRLHLELLKDTVGP